MKPHVRFISNARWVDPRGKDRGISLHGLHPKFQANTRLFAHQDYDSPLKHHYLYHCLYFTCKLLHSLVIQGSQQRFSLLTNTRFELRIGSSIALEQRNTRCCVFDFAIKRHAIRLPQSAN